MDDLRWILLAIALLVIVAIYFMSRNRKKNSNTFSADTTDDIPSFRADDSVNGDWVDSVGPVRVVTEDSGASTLSNFRDDLLGNFKNNLPNNISDSLQSGSSDIQNKSINVQLPVAAESLTELLPEKSPGKLPGKLPGKFSEPLKKEIQSAIEPEKNNSIENNLIADSPSTNDSAIATHPITPETSKKISQENAFQKNTFQENTPQSAEAPPASVDDENACVEDDVIAVYVLASSEVPVMTGDKILSASYALHLNHGDMKIFHFSDEVSVDGITKNEIQFSMASLQEPGWFDIENMNQLETRGLSFFMQARLVENPAAVLDEMLICAHKMSTMLGARLCNAQRKPLDEAYTKHLRNKVKRLMESKAGNSE